MKITVAQLRRLIQETFLDVKEDNIEESHEDPAAADVAQMNRQGDGDRYDQMGHIKTRKKKQRRT